jgi:drug/metabolite transporter (DMT)-like permease
MTTIFFPSVDMSRERIGELQLFISTMSYACAYVGQRWAMIHGSIGPFTFNFSRYVVALLFLFILRPAFREYSMIDNYRTTVEDELYLKRNGGSKSLWFWVVLAGLSNFGGSMLQQYSLVSLDVAKVGFITGGYVVLIPFVEVSCYLYVSAVMLF